MKKVILLLILAMVLIGCSSSDQEQSVQQNCNCGVVIEKANFNIPNYNFTVLKVKNNCTGEIKTIDVPGNVSAVGQQYCN